GEARDGLALQSSDSRIRPASESSPGIVELCKPGSATAGFAVQGNDPRLGDARTPLPHSHDYAPKEHDFSSHSGLIFIKAETGAPFTEIVSPPISHAPVVGQNHGGGAGV